MSAREAGTGAGQAAPMSLPELLDEWRDTIRELDRTLPDNEAGRTAIKVEKSVLRSVISQVERAVTAAAAAQPAPGGKRDPLSCPCCVFGGDDCWCRTDCGVERCQARDLDDEREQPAPGPAAGKLTEVLGWFADSAGTYRYARVTRAQLAHAYQDGGLEVPEELRRFL